MPSLLCGDVGFSTPNEESGRTLVYNSRETHIGTDFKVRQEEGQNAKEAKTTCKQEAASSP